MLGAWERLWAVPVQVAFSVIVLQVFRRKSISWLWLAIVAHAVFDFVTVAMVQLLGPGKISTNLIVELVVAVFGLIALWVIWRLRDQANVSVEQESRSMPTVG